jgi:hypothetical protein
VQLKFLLPIEKEPQPPAQWHRSIRESVLHRIRKAKNKPSREFISDHLSKIATAN